jgi:hypothetical protein
MLNNQPVCLAYVPYEHKQLHIFRSDLDLLYSDLRNGVCVIECRVVAEGMGDCCDHPRQQTGRKINILMEVFDLLCPKFKLLSHIEGK